MGERRRITYIIDVDSQERESEATRLLLTSLWKEDYLLRPMGLGSLSWVIMEVQKTGLIPGMFGDVDILAGNLDFISTADFAAAFESVRQKYPEAPQGFLERLGGKVVAEAGGIKWPPEPSYVVGVEVKCSYFDSRPRSTKSSSEKVGGIRKQIEWLLKMGLDRVALLDVIANRPSEGTDSGAWLAAALQAQASFDAVEGILVNRLPVGSPSGQFVWASGAVAGGDESIRGAGVPRLVKTPMPNPGLQSTDPDVPRNREELLKRIPLLLCALPRPRYFPVVFIDCRRCRHIHLLDGMCPDVSTHQ